MRFLWPDSIVVLNICGKYAVELLLMQDDQVVETLTPYTSETSFTDGIRSRGVIRCSTFVLVARRLRTCLMYFWIVRQADANAQLE
jgi:hypothetical protein